MIHVLHYTVYIICLRIVLILHFTVFIICFFLVLYFADTFCQHVHVIVIDKPIGLGGTVYTSTSIFV